MKLPLVFLAAFVPALASAETHVLCRIPAAGSYEFSFDESGRSGAGIRFRISGGEAVTGSRVYKHGPHDYSFHVKNTTVRFNRLAWRAEFETPGYPDMEPPAVQTYDCEPDPQYAADGAGI
jgi:hypothetical protein